MLDSFKYAYNGFRDALKSEANLSIHLLFGTIALIFAYYFEFTTIEFSVLLLVIFSVVILELVNTIVEKLVDMHSLKISEEARVIKDISAAIVLLSSVLAVIIGALLFIPKII